MKNIVIISFLVLGLGLKGFAQTTSTKRLLTSNELKQLKTLKDSILSELKSVYTKEVNERSPGKYQPQRIALVRAYLLLFNFMSDRLEVVNFTSKNVIDIVGKPDRIYLEDNYEIYEYTSLNRPYLRLKNLKYQLVFKNNELVFVHHQNN